VNQDSRRAFEDGLAILQPFFDSLDYALEVAEPTIDDEGTHYFARFNDGRRTVVLHDVGGLNSVIYTVGQFALEHGTYLDLLDVSMGAAFPPVDESCSGYEALLQDLNDLLVPFFDFPERDVIELAQVHGGRAPAWPPTLRAKHATDAAADQEE